MFKSFQASWTPREVADLWSEIRLNDYTPSQGELPYGTYSANLDENRGSASCSTPVTITINHNPPSCLQYLKLSHRLRANFFSKGVCNRKTVENWHAISALDSSQHGFVVVHYEFQSPECSIREIVCYCCERSKNIDRFLRFGRPILPSSHHDLPLLFQFPSVSSKLVLSAYDLLPASDVGFLFLIFKNKRFSKLNLPF